MEPLSTFARKAAFCAPQVLIHMSTPTCKKLQLRKCRRISSEMGNSSLQFDDTGCIKVVKSPGHLASCISGSVAETTLYVNSSGQIRSSARLVVLSITTSCSLAYGLVRPVMQRTCSRRRHETLFLELVTDAFPGAAKIARDLGVRRVPTVILWKDGKRVDHLSGFEARKQLDDFITDNL